GGIDHIPVHHTNEIAQSEGATGEQFVKYWVHHEFLLVDGTKMSKSLKNFYTIDDVKEKGFDPIALRYLFLTANYRDKLNFTWVSLGAAQNALNNLREALMELEISDVIANEVKQSSPNLEIAASPLAPRNDDSYYQKFLDSLNDNLNTSKALAVLFEVLKSEISDAEKAATVLEMDKVLGLELDKYIGQKLEIPQEVSELLEKRQNARDNKNFEASDKLRAEILRLGFEVLDTPEGQKVKKN
ncbi:MAG: class I tRNA ligase family protein, partial [Nanoarchaeota archaeon]